MERLNCGSDEVDCLIDATAEDLVDAVPAEWLNTQMAKLPKKMGTNEEKGHSWIIVDKNMFMESPMEYWKKNKGSNNVPIVIGTYNSFYIFKYKAYHIGYFNKILL